MQAVAEAFTSVRKRAGLSIGIIPGETDDNGRYSAGAYPNPYIELPIFTHLPLTGTKGRSMLSRNRINILSSTVIIALPGGAGTLSEIELAIQFNKPLFLYGPHTELTAHKGAVYTDLNELEEKIKAFL